MHRTINISQGRTMKTSLVSKVMAGLALLSIAAPAALADDDDRQVRQYSNTQHRYDHDWNRNRYRNDNDWNRNRYRNRSPRDWRRDEAHRVSWNNRNNNSWDWDHKSWNSKTRNI